MAEISCGGLGSGSTTPPPITVTVNPASGTVLFAAEPGNSWLASVTQQQFTATVNGSSNQNVTWTVAGGAANGTVNETGLYSSPTAVPSPGTISVTATSSFAQSPGTGFVNLVTATPLGSSQITAAATAVGGTAKGSMLTLTVQ